MFLFSFFSFLKMIFGFLLNWGFGVVGFLCYFRLYWTSHFMKKINWWTRNSQRTVHLSKSSSFFKTWLSLRFWLGDLHLDKRCDCTCLFNYSLVVVYTLRLSAQWWVFCLILHDVFCSLAGAVCVGSRAVRMPLLETWSSPVHVLPHPSSTETVDQEKQGHVSEGATLKTCQSSIILDRCFVLLLHIYSLVLTTLLICYSYVVYSRGGALPDADAASEELGEAQRWRGASRYCDRKRSVWR